MDSTVQVKPLSIFIATFFLSVFGSIWYGVLFIDVQIDAHRYTAEEYANSHPAWYIGGAVIAGFISWGIGQLYRLAGKYGIKAGILASTRAILGFGLPLITYPLVFSPIHELVLYIVGLSQIVIAWTIAGVIIGFMNQE